MDTFKTDNTIQKQQMLHHIGSMFAESLGFDQNDLDNESSLLEIGADSFTIMSTTRKVKKVFGVSLAIRDIFENLSTIDKISDYILENSVDLSALKDVKINSGMSNKFESQKDQIQPLIEKVIIPEKTIQKIEEESTLYNRFLTDKLDSTSLFSPKKVGQRKEDIAEDAASAWVGDSQKSQLTEEQEMYMRKFITNYCEKTSSSKNIAQESRPYLCNNRKSSSGFRIETKEMLYPIVAKRSKGSNIWDLDGNCYVDIAMGFGSTLFGHNPDFIKNRLIDQMEQGVQIGPESDMAAENAKLIASVTKMDRVLFSNTGTEAVMTAIRIARAATSSKKVVLFQNSYHGHSDTVLAIPDVSSDKIKSKGMVPGIPASAVEDTIILPYANINALSYIEENAHDIAAVVVEPVQNYLGNSNPGEFLKAAREITKKYGIVLIFDEVLVGFRIALGGAQDFFDVEADIATYGKAVAGGIPVGVIAGKSWCMDYVDGGFWSYGDNSAPKGNQTYTAGTFCKHPLAMTAVNAAMKEMIKKGPALQQSLNQKTEELCSILDEIIANYQIPLKIHRFGSNFRFSMLGNLSFAFQPLELDIFFYHLINEGIYVWEGRTCFISTAHSDDDLNKIIQGVHNAIIRMKKGGFWITPDMKKKVTVTNNNKSPVQSIEVNKGGAEIEYQQNKFEFTPKDVCFSSPENKNTSKISVGFPEIRVANNVDKLFQYSKIIDSTKINTIWLESDAYSNEQIILEGMTIPSMLAMSKNTNIRVSLNVDQADLKMVAEQWTGINQIFKNRVGFCFKNQHTVIKADFNTIEQFLVLWQSKNSNLVVSKSEFPFWVEIQCIPEEFRLAGSLGLGIVFTPSLVDVDILKVCLSEYKNARKSAGFLPEEGHIIAKLYTSIGTDTKVIQEENLELLLKKVLTNDSFLDELFPVNLKFKKEVLSTLSDKERLFVLEDYVEQFILKSTLIGNEEYCIERYNSLIELGIDEINCLVNYGESDNQSQKTIDCLKRSFLSISTDEPQKLGKINYESLCPIVSPEFIGGNLTQNTLISGLIKSNDDDLVLPMTDDQKTLYMLSKISDGAMMTNSQTWALRVKGILDLDRLRKAYQKVTDRHLGLRVTLDEETELQTFHAHFTVEISEIDHRDLKLDEANKRVYSYLKEEASRQYDLSKSFHRLAVISLSDNESVIVLSCNHITIDGVSVSVVYTELTAFYNDLSLELEETLSFDKFIHWRQIQSEEEDFIEQEKYWLNEVSSDLPLLDLPLDFPRPIINSYNGSSYKINLGSDFFKDLKEFSIVHKCTYFMVVYAAFQVLLHRITGQKKMVIGVAFNGRTIPNSDFMVGFCANMYPIINDIDPHETTLNFLSRVKEKLFSAFENQDYPFSSLIRKGLKQRDASRFPFFSVAFNWDRLLLPQMDGADVSWETFKQEYVKFDLVPNLMEVNNELTMMLEYNTDLFKEETIHQFCEYYELILKEMVYEPQTKIAELGNVLPLDKNNQLKNWQGKKMKVFEEEGFHQLFEKQALENPEKIALVSEKNELTYKEVNEQANRLAHLLCSSNQEKKQQLIGICLDRSIDQVVSLLAIMKAGMAYVPLDPSYPEKRLHFLLENSGVSRVIMTRKQEKLLNKEDTQFLLIDDASTKMILKKQSKENLNKVISSEDLLYVIYTSGSTGQPKGVKVAHRGILNLAHNLSKHFNEKGIEQSGRWGWNSSFSFDGSLNALTQLFLGRPLVLLQDIKEKTPEQVWRYLEENKIKIWDVSPSQLRVLITDIKSSQVKCAPSIVIGGEATDQSLWNEIIAYCKTFDVTALNVYGPTECSVVSHISIIPDYVYPTIGKTLDNVEAFIVDEQLNLMPSGSKGELLLGGSGLALGYLGNTQLTNEKFIQIPNLSNGKLYRTGDLVRWLSDGTLEFIGRTDNQVQIRGTRVELGEVESIINSIKEVNKAVVIAANDIGGSSLTVYVVLADNNKHLSEVQVFEKVKQHLPSHMLPSVLLIIEEIPLTVNGKVDESRLPLPNTTILKNYTAPSTDVEKVMCMVWEDMIQLEKIGIHDDFFVIGGHSLLATRIISRIRSLMGVELTLPDFFKYSTISLLAQKINSENKEESNQIISRTSSSIEKEGQLSFAQSRLWFLSSIEKANSAYNINECFWIEGIINAEKLDWALSQIVTRHHVLRSRIIEKNDVPVSVVYSLPETILEITEQIEQTENDFVDSNCKDLFGKPFDLSKDLLIRARLLRCKSGKEMLLLSLHHIAADGWSMGILKQEITTLYSSYLADVKSLLVDLPIQYSDYAKWQKETVSAETLNMIAKYWKKQLNAIPDLHNLPVDYPRPAVKSYKGSAIGYPMPSNIYQGVKKMSKEKGTTIFIILQSAFATLISRWSNERDIVIGTPINNRTQSQLEPLIGFFINTVVFKNRINTNHSFYDQLEVCKDMILEAYEHQSMPFELLVEELNPERSLSYSPIFQIMFAMENNESNDLEFDGVKANRRKQEYSTSKFDITLYITENDKELFLEWEFDVALFSKNTIECLSNSFILLLEQILDNPRVPLSKINILTEEDKRNQLSTWQGKKTDLSSMKNFHSLLEHQAGVNPNGIAIDCDGKKITYKVLNEKSNRLSRLIRAKKIKEGTSVGLCIEASEEQIIGILAILKSGLSYVPLDPTLPSSRLAYILDDANIQLVITKRSYSNMITKSEKQLLVLDDDDTQSQWSKKMKSNLDLEIDVNDSMYIIYTSGSTGKPKGVEVRHQGLLNHAQNLDDKLNELNVNKEKSWGWNSPFTFDGSLNGLSQCFMGRTLIILNGVKNKTGEEFWQYVSELEIGIMDVSPSQLQVLLPSLVNVTTKTVPSLIIGGEATGPSLWNEISKYCQKYNTTAVNVYGPTECSVVTHMSVIPENTLPTIGKTVDNVEAFVVDQEHNLLPTGAKGELIIGGVGVAKHYVGKKELTNEKFIIIPSISSSLLYKTGDIVKWLPNGQLEYYGRIDDQIQVRGIRVELGEVTSIIKQLDEVLEAVIRPSIDDEGITSLVAYIVLNEEFHSYDETYLQNRFREVLPTYMLPSYIRILDHIPLTENGKIDASKLSFINEELVQKGYEPSQNELEEKLIQIWKDVLQNKQIGRHDNFFVVGGHSLAAARVVSAIRNQFEIELDIKELFLFPTVKDLSLLLEQKEKCASLLKIVPANKTEKIPLSFAQERIWFIDKLEGSVHYHMPAVFHLKGEIDFEIMSEAFRKIVDRHEVLKIVYREEEGIPYQFISNENTWSLGYEEKNIIIDDISTEKLISEELYQPFNLSSDHAIRAKLIKIAKEEYILLIVMHHIASDGWSVGIFLSELTTLYNDLKENKESQLEKLTIQYTDYAIWQRTHLTEDILAKKMQYWQTKLANINPLNLPLDFPRPKIQSIIGKSMMIPVENLWKNQLEILAKEEGVTMFMLLLSVFKLMLQRYSGQDDIAVGTPIANRTQYETEKLIGYFTNTLVLATDLTDTITFKDLLYQVKDSVLEAINHQDVPFEQIVNKLEKVRDLSRSPLFQVMFVFDNENQLPDVQLPNASISIVPFSYETSKFDLTMSISTSTSGMEIGMAYCSDLFLSSTIERMLLNYHALLKSVIENPSLPISQLNMLDDEQESFLINNENSCSINNQTSYSSQATDGAHDIIEL